MLGALVRLDADHDGRRPPSLRDDEGLLRSANPLESRGRVLPEIGNRDDVKHLGHRRSSFSTPKSTFRRPFERPSPWSGRRRDRSRGWPAPPACQRIFSRKRFVRSSRGLPKKVLGSPVSTITPSSMKTTRSATSRAK